MTVVRAHRYSVDPADVQELNSRRAALITAIRIAHPGLVETRLTRFADDTYTDVWCWDTAEQVQSAFADLPNFPEASATMSLTRDATAHNGEIVDEL